MVGVCGGCVRAHAVFDGAAREGVLEKGTSEKRHEEGEEQKQ